MRLAAFALASLLVAGCIETAPPDGPLPPSAAFPPALVPYQECTWAAEGVKGSCGPFFPTVPLSPVAASQPPPRWHCYSQMVFQDWPRWKLLGRWELPDGEAVPRLWLGLWYNLTGYAGGPVQAHFVRWTAPEPLVAQWTLADRVGFVRFPDPVAEAVFRYELSFSPTDVVLEPTPFEWSRSPMEHGDPGEWRTASFRLHADGLGGPGGLTADWTLLPGEGDDAPRLWPTFRWQGAPGGLHVPTAAAGWPGSAFGGLFSTRHGHGYLGEVYKARLQGDGYHLQAEMRQLAGFSGAVDTRAPSDYWCHCEEAPPLSAEGVECDLEAATGQEPPGVPSPTPLEPIHPASQPSSLHTRSIPVSPGA